MKKLHSILADVSIIDIIGGWDLDIELITFDSRKVIKDSLFIAIKGSLSDGHLYIDKAIENGAIAIVCEVLPKQYHTNITYLKVADSNLALAYIASNFYDRPSEKLKLVGITGTNGKTTLATLSYKLFSALGLKAGLISTVIIKVVDKEFPTLYTTPDAITINMYLEKMLQEGVTHCFMEVSSHGIHQKRTEALHFKGGVFTNLTHDHLDYHTTFKEYRDVKKSFFDKLEKNAFALSNWDDKNGKVMLQNTKALKKTYALKTMADYSAKVLENSIEGLHLLIDNQEIYAKLIGLFNAYNLLAIYAIARELNIDKMQALTCISNLESVSGRFQYFISKNGITTIVDYAHTPDALLNVLQTINEIKKGNEKIVTVVGCGGDRDKTKRPKMGAIAAQLSATSIFTSDNPRSEDPNLIIEEMEKGLTEDLKQKTLSIVDRKQAIKTASKLVSKGDIVLIAGKGHESYQEIKGIKYEFDDLRIAKEIFDNQ